MSTNSPHVYTVKPLMLFLHNLHYYAISDMTKLMISHYRCIACVQEFRERYGKICYSYRSGVVEAHANMWTEAKHMFSIQDDILCENYDDDYQYTKMFATFDFESMLVKQNVADVEYSAQTCIHGAGGYDYDDVVYDNDGTVCTEREYMAEHKDNIYVTISTPCYCL